jgi:hypothetical protein
MRARAPAHYREELKGHLDLPAALFSFLWRSPLSIPLPVVTPLLPFSHLRDFQVCVGSMVDFFRLGVLVQVL